MTIQIASTRERPVADEALEAILRRVYVEEGFTPPAVAAKLFAAPVVRARGELLCAWAESEREPIGTVIMVPPTSTARRIARADEAEMHLLGVDRRHRGGGVGARLVEAAEAEARRAGFKRIVLWTQPAMRAAQRLYASGGFARAPSRDAEIAAVTGRVFLVYEKAFDLWLRPARAADQAFLLTMLFYAAHADLEPGVIPAHLLANPALARYVVDFGRPGDLGVVAIRGEVPVGAAWVRLLAGGERGYGWVDDDTPELAVAVHPEAVNTGVGTAMLTDLLARARERYPGVSLSVRADNPARRLYLRLGFEPVADVTNRVGGTSQTMRLRFRPG
ncbi:MAG TPA: GNAT family N-acetyltransferase [Polyangiaceae bacterium]|nr:GNAT family N-acetyltransferase [Polyangiaceae bacterium]